jgi:hypothetical protein
MKIVLTREELTEAIRKHYPAPPNQVIVDVVIASRSEDFCTVAFADAPPVPLDETTEARR